MSDTTPETPPAAETIPIVGSATRHISEVPNPSAAEMANTHTVPPEPETPTGALLIAAERQRQISKEGWTTEHDDGDLTDAALCYATVASAEVRGSSAEEWPVEMFNGHNDSILTWPWEDEAWKPSDDPVRNLVKAGALIAAEIDRLQRKEAK